MFRPLNSDDFISLDDICMVIEKGHLPNNVIDGYAGVLMKHQDLVKKESETSFVLPSLSLVRITQH